ncbi:MAG: HesA/MoeB/ThiF family protein [Candidatus Nanoarchaeia archaeon]
MKYDRHRLFLGDKKQKMLEKSTAAIIGMGALGGTVANLLARSGINLIIIDRDVVDETNLQRQTLFDEEDIGNVKAEVAEKKLKQINSRIKIKNYAVEINKNNLDLVKADIIVDCVDNMKTKFLLNDFAIKQKIPLVHGAAIREIGTLYNVMPGGPCLRCIYREKANTETCATVGVLNTLTTIIGAMQAMEAIKILTKEKYEKDMLRINIWKNTITRIKIKKNKKCIC